MPRALERFGQLPRALACPAQSRLRVPARRGLDQALQTRQQLWILLRHGLAATTESPHTIAFQAVPRTALCQLTQTLVDRRARQPRRPGYRRNPTPPELPRFYGRPETTLSLVEDRAQELVLLLDRLFGLGIHAKVSSTLEHFVQVIYGRPLSNSGME